MLMRNSWVWVIFPDKTGKPVLKRRRLSVELAEYGTKSRLDRLVYDTKEEAEILLNDGNLWLQHLEMVWKLNTIVSGMTSTNLSILTDVARALESGKVVTIKGRPVEAHATEIVDSFLQQG